MLQVWIKFTQQRSVLFGFSNIVYCSNCNLFITAGLLRVMNLEICLSSEVLQIKQSPKYFYLCRGLQRGIKLLNEKEDIKTAKDIYGA